MSNYAPIPPSVDSLERMWALVEQDETRLKRSRAVRLGRRLRDTGLPWLQAALRRLVLIALVSAVVLVLILALASGPWPSCSCQAVGAVPEPWRRSERGRPPLVILPLRSGPPRGMGWNRRRTEMASKKHKPEG